MLSYDKWKLLNESLNRPSTLGISQPTKLGLISNQPLLNSSDENLEECGCDYEEEEDMEDEEGDDIEIDAEEFGSPEGDGEAVEVHAGLDDEDDMEDEGDDEDDMEDDEDEDDMEDDEDEDDEDDEDDMEEDEDDMEEDEDDMEEDEDDMEEDEDDMEEDEDDMEEDEDDMEEDEDDMEDKHAMHAHHKHMDMPESKKLPKGMISENAWWTSVRSMIGTMSPSGDIKEDTANPAEAGAAAENDEDKLEMMLEKIPGLPSDAKQPAKMFLKAFFAKDNSQGSKTQLLNFIDLLLDLAIDKALESDKATFNQIKTHLTGHLQDLRQDKMGAW